MRALFSLRGHHTSMLFRYADYLIIVVERKRVCAMLLSLRLHCYAHMPLFAYFMATPERCWSLRSFIATCRRRHIFIAVAIY